MWVRKNFGWLVKDFFEGNVNLCNSFRNAVSANVDTTFTLLREPIDLREEYFYFLTAVFYLRGGSERQCDCAISCMPVTFYSFVLCTSYTISIIIKKIQRIFIVSSTG